MTKVTRKSHTHSCGYSYKCYGTGAKCAGHCHKKYKAAVLKGKKPKDFKCLCTKSAPKFTEDMCVVLLQTYTATIPTYQNVGRKEKIEENWNKLSEKFGERVGFRYHPDLLKLKIRLWKREVRKTHNLITRWHIENNRSGAGTMECPIPPHKYTAYFEKDRSISFVQSDSGTTSTPAPLPLTGPASKKRSEESNVRIKHNFKERKQKALSNNGMSKRDKECLDYILKGQKEIAMRLKDDLTKPQQTTTTKQQVQITAKRSLRISGNLKRKLREQEEENAALKRRLGEQ